MTLFVVSDTHFGHKKILDLEKRPFRSIDMMDEGLIHRWNGVVGKQDTVYHLGDFSFYGSKKTEDIFSKLNGYIRLILGNHDRGHSHTWWKGIGFQSVSLGPVIWGENFIFSHEPIEIDLGGFVNVHGHIHGKTPSFARESERHFNVSVDVMAYRPLAFDSIKEEFEKRGVL
jgi:calcineurin-like phosphoesterase family protein